MRKIMLLWSSSSELSERPSPGRSSFGSNWLIDYFHPYKKCPELANPYRQKADLWLPVGGNTGNEE